MTGFEDVPIEAVARYWNSRPCNIRHSPKPVGTGEYFDEVEARKYRIEPHIPRFAEFDRWKGRRVLELGCGIGTDTMNFARAGAMVTAVDLSRESLKVARERAKVLGLADRIRFYHGNGEELSKVVPVEAYDLAYSFGVIHHTPHPARVVAELRKYLNRGGTLKLMVYHRHSWKVLSILLTSRDWLSGTIGECVANRSEAQTECPVTYIYSKAESRRLVEPFGFRVTDIWTDHIFSYRVSDYVRYRYVRSWCFRWMPAPLFRALERQFGWHLCLTAEAV